MYAASRTWFLRLLHASNVMLTYGRRATGAAGCVLGAGSVAPSAGEPTDEPVSVTGSLVAGSPGSGSPVGSAVGSVVGSDPMAIGSFARPPITGCWPRARNASYDAVLDEIRKSQLDSTSFQ